LALVDDVPFNEIDETIDIIIRAYRGFEAIPRVRLSPLSAPEWPDRLHARGFNRTAECRRFWRAPRELALAGNPDLVISGIHTQAEADRFAAIQALGYGIPERLLEWDRSLARRHVGCAHERFYIGRYAGEDVAVIASRAFANGTAALWGLAALPATRGKGIGTAMLGRAISDARCVAEDIFFTTAWNNEVERLYDRLGIERLFATATYELSSR
jgi:ribosomal protein S18 acetylase RimI-like enzyme